MKLIARTLSLVFVFGALAAISHAQSSEQNVNVNVQPAQTVEERVIDSAREKQLREVAEERMAAEKSARAASKNPRTLLSRAQTFFVSSGTSFFEPVQLQNALRKRAEFDDWELAIIDAREKRGVADVTVEIDRPSFTYTFTYKITDRGTGILLSSGKLTAFDGNAAAPRLAKRIIEDIKNARAAERER